MRLIFTFILMLCSGMVDAQNIIKKCKTCGKPISQCQYKGTHVASSSVSPSPQKKRNHVKKTPQTSQAHQMSSLSNQKVSSEGKVIIIPVKDGINIEMVKVEAGTFMMGPTSELEKPYHWEKPRHKVTLTKDYYIGKYEVTQALWQVVMGNNPSDFKGDNFPVEKVSWNDCQAFITKLNGITGRKFRLPTEAEWENAARGGRKSQAYQYCGSNNISDVAWYWDNNTGMTHVGGKLPNELGIYDMSGNVLEWCQDLYGAYASSSQINPKGVVSGTDRVFRSGGWNGVASSCRLSCRSGFAPNVRCNYLGLRLALSE